MNLGIERSSPEGLASGRRARGVAVRADDPAAATATQSTGPSAGCRHVDLADRLGGELAFGNRPFCVEPPPRRLMRNAFGAHPKADRNTPAAKGTLRIVIAMELVGVRVEVPANTPVVILREQTEPHRVLPILIGSPEASAIHTALSGLVAPRPMTHDLIVELLRSTDAALDKVVVTEIRDHTFYAELHLLAPTAARRRCRARPSDALAAGRAHRHADLRRRDLLDEAGSRAGRTPRSSERGGAILDEFRDFLEEINPETSRPDPACYG